MTRIRTMAATAGGIGLTGAIYGAFLGFDASMILLAGVSALVAGGVFAPLMGRPGRRGWALALLAALGSTMLGAALAGGLFVFPKGLWIGPAVVANFATVSFWIWPVWVGLMASVHVLTALFRGWQPEQKGTFLP